MRSKIFIWLLVTGFWFLSSGLASAAKKVVVTQENAVVTEENAVRQAFENYKVAVIAQDFSAVYDMINPEVLAPFEKAYARAKTNEEYRHLFLTTNFGGEEPSLENTAKELFIKMAKMVAAGKWIARSGDELESIEGFKAGKIVKIEVAKPKAIPRGVPLSPEAKKEMEKLYAQVLNTAGVGYEMKDRFGEVTTTNITFKKIKDKWMLNYCPVNIWTEEEAKEE